MLELNRIYDSMRERQVHVSTREKNPGTVEISLATSLRADLSKSGKVQE